jgi:hypothetical protein
MRNYILSISMSLLVFGNAAFAADEPDTSKKTDEAPAKTEATAAPAKTKEKVKVKPEKTDKTEKTEKKASKDDGGGAGGVASHIGSFVAGTFVGIPVSIFRHSKTETINATKDLVGDTDKKWLIGAASVLGVPAGILSGTLQGFVWGPLNAYRGTKDEPFSPEAFSLGDAK